MQREFDQRYNAGKRLEQLLTEIRALPKFARFLLAPTEDELKAAAKYGPIVIINVSDYRCDALIIEKNQIRALSLPLLHKSDIRDRATNTGVDEKLLKWLWDTVAQPVLNTLRFTQIPSEGCLPHIWWIPTGLLARMPIHAAGYHSQGSSNTVLDRVVSSYSSSVKAMIYSRQSRHKERIIAMSKKAVLIGMKKTPDQNDLHFITREVNVLKRLFKSMKVQVSKPRCI